MYVNLWSYSTLCTVSKYSAALEFKGFGENDHRSLVFT